MSVTLYTTHCPRCEVLKKKLDNAGIKYAIVEDEKKMLDKGFTSAPMLEVDGEIMDFIKEEIKIQNTMNYQKDPNSVLLGQSPEQISFLNTQVHSFLPLYLVVDIYDLCCLIVSFKLLHNAPKSLFSRLKMIIEILQSLQVV